ncbi:hypothetical protein ABZ686_10770 [Streptomyces sp. NPDC006992]|uniref:hypothetical protein n=1 Tax=Streptomyces sp. NPDC006992 TaxID=3155601 RepID=UPI00340DF00C
MAYTVTSHPDGERSMKADCLHHGCGWELGPTADPAAGERELRLHYAETGHGTFARNFEDVAVVVLADVAEQQRRVEVDALEYAHWGGADEDAADDLRQPTRRVTR